MYLAWALFVLDPAVMGGYLRVSLGYGDPFVLTWFVASAVTVGGPWAPVWSRRKRSVQRRTPSARRSAATGSLMSGPRRLSGKVPP